ncbi:hypothetical protein [Actinoplanes friuliensis]|jgi:hypothetical protein|uniref:Regulator of G-protein signaling 12 n=1 Tax=Actinoplanes friuliensis DSM 7358 TaxID=1246995 RepID=U5WC00_9ACTN|nr:hypothetical protein [Actinoplanes friuliensis]AGZ46517.1 Regulator of G-protein signaling 12 [Actinoplanes friuliensis DSM 7358]
MRSLGSRRAALVTGVAAVAAVALAGCSAGQVAETALKRPSNMGVNADSSDKSVYIRNLSVQYPGTAGYAAGDSAPLELGIFNQTKQPITVLVSSRPVTDESVKDEIVSARVIGLSGGAAATPSAPSSAIPEPSGSRPSGGQDDQNSEQIPSPDPSDGPSPAASPSAATPAVRPARIELEPLGAATFLPGDKETLQAVGLSGKLVPGQSVSLVFEFSNGAEPLVLQAPVAIPLSPASRGPGIPHENSEE